MVFIKVSLSSLNRHAVATREDVGTSKAMCLQVHFSNPGLISCMFTEFLMAVAALDR